MVYETCFTFQVVEIKLQIEFQEKRKKALNLKRISRKGNCIPFHKKSCIKPDAIVLQNFTHWSLILLVIEL